MIQVEAWSRETNEKLFRELESRALRGDHSAFQDLAQLYRRVGRRLPILDVPLKWYEGLDTETALVVMPHITVWWEMDYWVREYVEDPDDPTGLTLSEHAEKEPHSTLVDSYSLTALVEKLKKVKKRSHGDSLGSGTWEFWIFHEDNRPYDYTEEHQEFTPFKLSHREKRVVEKLVAR